MLVRNRLGCAEVTNDLMSLTSCLRRSLLPPPHFHGWRALSEGLCSGTQAVRAPSTGTRAPLLVQGGEITVEDVLALTPPPPEETQVSRIHVIIPASSSGQFSRMRQRNTALAQPLRAQHQRLGKPKTVQGIRYGCLSLLTTIVYLD